MRLWHQELIKHLPAMQLNGQHRECCALRGLGWGKRHSTVDYVFRHNPAKLSKYHMLVLEEKRRRGPSWVDYRWSIPTYRGERAGWWSKEEFDVEEFERAEEGNIYPEHNDEYLAECMRNLLGKKVRMYEWEKWRK